MSQRLELTLETFPDLRAQQNGSAGVGGGVAAGDRWQEDASRRLTSRTMRVPPPTNGKKLFTKKKTCEEKYQLLLRRFSFVNGCLSSNLLWLLCM